MARAWRIRFAGAKYHVTVRGNGRQVVFHGDDYYLRFVEQLSDALEKDGVILYAFVLMPNHYHLFVETPFGNIQRFMQRLNTSYSMYRHYKHQSPGHCFQGRYGAKLVKGDEYVLRLTRYIHLNPVKVEACGKMNLAQKMEYLNLYKWSSYRGYVGEATGFALKVNRRWLRLLQGKSLKRNRAAYRQYVQGCVAATDEELRAVLEANRYAVGDEKFIEKVESDLRDVQVNRAVYGDIQWPEGRKLTLDEVSAAVAKEFRREASELLTRKITVRTARKLALELACRYSGASQRQVGEYYGYKGNGSVLKQRQKLKGLLGEDKRLQKRMNKTEKRLLNA